MQMQPPPPLDHFQRGRRRAAATRETQPEVAATFRVFVAYSDVSSARLAVARISRIVRHRCPRTAVQPLFWRFNQIEDPRWREMALDDACRASHLMLALGAAASFHAATEAWLKALITRAGNSPLTVLAFLADDDEIWTVSLQSPASRCADLAPSAARVPLRLERSAPPGMNPVGCAA